MTLDMYDNDTMKFNYEGNQYCLHVRQDDMPSNPRRDWDHEGTQMVCWHRYYDLGDERRRDDPEDFWRYLAESVVSNDEIKGALLSKSLSVWAENDVDDGYIVHFRSWNGNEETYVSEKNSLVYDTEDDLSIGDYMKLLEGKAVWLPLYLYDHSGITMSTGGFSDPWDSGQVGWIVCTKEAAIKKIGYKEEDWEKRAIDLMETEVKVYDQYLTNDVYGFQLMKRTGADEDNDDDEEAWEEVDSCWGFFGTNIMENGMCEYVPGLAEAIESGKYEEGDAKLVTHSYFTY